MHSSELLVLTTRAQRSSLDDGYNITRVRPIIKSIVEADGDVVTKATSAIVMLEKDASHASVWVDLEDAKVTQIVILTRTVIEKP